MIQVGDVLMTREDVKPTRPYARVFYAGEWHEITLYTDAMFVIVKVDEPVDGNLALEVASLTAGMCFPLQMRLEDVFAMLTVLRGKSMVLPESCGTVGLS